METNRVIVSESDSEGGGESSISNESLSQVYLPDSGFLRSQPQSMTASSGSVSGNNEFWARGRTEATVPWYEYHEYKELSSRTFRSLEEQLFIKKAQLKMQEEQHAAILRPGRGVEFVKTPTLSEFPNSLRGEFLQECCESAGCFKSPEEAEREVRALEESLLSREQIVIDTTSEPIDEDDEFRDSKSSKV